MKKDKTKDPSIVAEEETAAQAAESEAAISDTEPDSEESAHANEAIDWQSQFFEKQKQHMELLDRLQRTLAEFDNFRKRTIKEKASIYDRGVSETIEKLLPVVDNLERALTAADNKESSLYKGLDMTFRQLSDLLTQIGIEPLPGEGTAFDPNMHNAVAHMEDDSLSENIIVEELQKGYKYRDRILRPSMVKVAN